MLQLEPIMHYTSYESRGYAFHYNRKRIQNQYIEGDAATCTYFC